MAANEQLLVAVRTQLFGFNDIVEKRIVKGIGFMWRGNLMCSVSGDDLLIRVSEDNYAKWVTAKGARPMIMGTREAIGWMYLDNSAVGTPAGLTKWMNRAIAHSQTLPSK